MNQKILFAKSGLKEVLQYLETYKRYKIKNIHPLNQGRYFIVFGTQTIAVVFKKDWYNQFGKMGFSNEDGIAERGLGESVNVEDLQEMARHGVKVIYTMHSSGEIYHITFLDFLLHSHTWRNKEGKPVRSISIHRLKRLNKNAR